jgi:hypothetical protein
VLWPIYPVLGLLGIARTGFTIVKLGGKILRSRFARPVVTRLVLQVGCVCNLSIAIEGEADVRGHPQSVEHDPQPKSPTNAQPPYRNRGFHGSIR